MLMRALVRDLPSWLSEGECASAGECSGRFLSDVRFLASTGRAGWLGSYGEIMLLSFGGGRTPVLQL